MAKMHPMVSMEMDDEDQIDAPQPIAMPDKPRYPYGLQICLTAAEMKALDLDPSEAFVGGIVHLHALARITSVSISDNAPSEWSKGGAQCRIEMQIEDLCIESEDEENEETG
jgi:hypothetical protein